MHIGDASARLQLWVLRAQVPRARTALLYQAIGLPLFLFAPSPWTGLGLGLLGANLILLVALTARDAVANDEESEPSGR